MTSICFRDIKNLSHDRGGFLLLVLSIVLTGVASSQTVESYRFVPYVIRTDRSLPVTFEAKITGGPTSVSFEYAGADRPMKDDGTAGDRIAGDGIYTTTFQPNEIVERLTTDDVFRPFIGYCKVLSKKHNIFADVWTPDIPLLEIQQISPTAQATAHVVNMVGEVSGVNFDPRPWTHIFYQHFDDEYDFLNVVLFPSSPRNRYHSGVSNHIQGIGKSLYDNSSSFGSDGALLGISVFPIPGLFDGAERGYIHELGHHWINFLGGTPFETAIPHWPISDVAPGVMGFNIPGSNVGGSFPYVLIPWGGNYRLDPGTQVPAFNDLELYLMGLLGPDSVGTHFVFQDQNQSLSDGAILAGPVTYVSIDSLISLVGPRVPSVATSPKYFHVGTILISDSLLSQEAMSFYDYFAARAGLRYPVRFSSGFLKDVAKPFFVATGGRAELDPRITMTTGGVSLLDTHGSISFRLEDNHPNPFNPTTTIDFQLPDVGWAKLSVFDALGRRVAVLVESELSSGAHTTTWNAESMASGLYFYRLEVVLVDNPSTRFVDVKKMVLIR